MSGLIVLKTLELGLIFSILSFGVYISFRILNIPDLTVDASFTTGCAVCAVCTLADASIAGLVLAFVAGCLCGLGTAFLQTKMRIQPLLAGILMMVGLYSINLRIMSGAPNLSLFQSKTIFDSMLPDLFVLLILVCVVGGCLIVFFKTRLGLMIRATGDNEVMVRSSSIPVDRMKQVGLALSNGIVSFSGALLTQYQGFADVSGGTGMMVLGLAGIIIGEAVFRKHWVLACVTGSCLYRLIYQFVLLFGIPASDMNLMSAVLVAIMISLPYLSKKRRKGIC